MKDYLKTFKLNQDLWGNLFTLGLFALIGVLIFNYFKTSRITRETTSSAQTEAETVKETKPEMTVKQVVAVGLPANYTVKKGDSLWSIAEKAYGSGFEWTTIYVNNKANISDPGLISTGDKIVLPKLEPKTFEYTVVKGDSMWGIAKSFCDNGNLWQSIATQNSIPNPRLIEPGLKLKFVCR